MKALVVYESIYGNTKLIAGAVAAGLAGDYETELSEVGQAQYSMAEGIDLLVVGGPTQMWGMTRGFSRAGARKTGKQHGVTIVSKGIGVREWLGKLPESDGVAAGAFDTRVSTKFPTGSAAKGIAARLEKKGFSVVVEPEGFYVADSEGPLREGELDRARQWGARLAHLAQRKQSPAG